MALPLLGCWQCSLQKYLHHKHLQGHVLHAKRAVTDICRAPTAMCSPQPIPEPAPRWELLCQGVLGLWRVLGVRGCPRHPWQVTAPRQAGGKRASSNFSACWYGLH